MKWLVWGCLSLVCAQPPFGGGFPPGGGPPGAFGPGAPERKLVRQFDKDGDGRLNRAERAAARESLSTVRPGVALKPEQVRAYGRESLYDPQVLRTLFLTFENADWEQELAAFHNTDVEVPATLTMDGKTLREVGVRFRGMSSYMMVGEGRKRSLNLTIDFADGKQNLLGYRTLNLLNSHMDPTFLRSVLYLQAARDYIPAPKANFLRVVINGENWGIYPNAQQVNADFGREWFGGASGARWKVQGSPMGRGGLKYLGAKPDAYKQIYTLKSKEREEDWAALIELCRVLTETPLDGLEAALEPLLDVEGTLRFLALEKTLINSDGYWARASDYYLYRDAKGRFHLIPHDANETFAPPEGGPMMGPPPMMGAGAWVDPSAGGPPMERMPQREGVTRPDGMRAGGRFGGARAPRDAKLDLLAGAEDPDKVLLSRLLAVPALRDRYFALCRQIAAKWLDWDQLEPVATAYRRLIGDDVRIDTRKLTTTEAFDRSLTEDVESGGFGPFGGRTMSLKRFAAERRDYVLQYRAPAAR